MLPGGLPAWTSQAEPGHVHDITAARHHALPALYRAAALGMPTLADGGYEGAGIGIHVPVKNPPGNQLLDPGTKTRNSLLRGLRSQGERGFALLTQRWTILLLGHALAGLGDLPQADPVPGLLCLGLCPLKSGGRTGVNRGPAAPYPWSADSAAPSRHRSSRYVTMANL